MASTERICRAGFLAVGLENAADSICTKEQLRSFLYQIGKNPSSSQLTSSWNKAENGSLSLTDCMNLIDHWPNRDQESKQLEKSVEAICKPGAKLSFNQLDVLLGQALRHEGITLNELKEAFQCKDGDTIDFQKFLASVHHVTESTVAMNLAKLDEHEKKGRADERDRRNSRTKEHRSNSKDSTASSSKPPSTRVSTKRSSSNKTVSEIQGSARSQQASTVASPARSVASSSGQSTTHLDSKTVMIRMKPLLGRIEPPERRVEETAHKLQQKGCMFVEEQTDSDEVNAVANHYELLLTEKTKLLVSIKPVQNCDMPQKANQQHHDLVLYIMDKNQDEIVACTDKLGNCAEFKTQAFVEVELDAGQYVLMPFTTRLRMQNLKAVGIDNSKRAVLIDTSDDGARKLSKRFRSVLMNIFDMFDLDNTGLLSRHQFSLYNIQTGGYEEHVTDDEWTAVQNTCDTKDGQLTLKGFLRLHQLEAEDPDGDVDDMWSSLYNAGYDDSLQMSRSWPFLIEVQSSSTNSELAVRPFDYVFSTSVRDCFWRYWSQHAQAVDLISGKTLSVFKMPSHILCFTADREMVSFHLADPHNCKLLPVITEESADTIVLKAYFVIATTEKDKWTFNVIIDD